MVMRPLRRTLFPAPFRAKQLPLHLLRHHPLFATIVYALSNPIAKPKSASSVKSASRAISTLMVWPSFTLADFASIVGQLALAGVRRACALSHPRSRTLHR